MGMGDQTVKRCCAPNQDRPPGSSASAPISSTAEGPVGEMVTLPGGTFLMGTDYPQGFPEDGEGPVRPVALSPFAIDVAPVTNAQFAAFVEATGYRTEAEHFGWSFVFWSLIDTERFRDLVTDTVAAAPWWCQVSGAAWFTPEGPGSSIASRQDHPVVHVSHNDAHTYAQWAGKDLPTEAEWEYAARGGLEQKLYAWGDDLLPDGQHRCNVWQGEFPKSNTVEDGFDGTCPVRAFPPNGFGLYSVQGNTWEWTADWFGTAHAATLSVNPRGPAQGPGRVLKGGSFLCHASYCNRYRVAARTASSTDASMSNLGFRCVRRTDALRPK